MEHPEGMDALHPFPIPCPGPLFHLAVPVFIINERSRSGFLSPVSCSSKPREAGMGTSDL